MALTINVRKNRDKATANLNERLKNITASKIAQRDALTNQVNNSHANAMELAEQGSENNLAEQALADKGAMSRTALLEGGRNKRDLRGRIQHIGDQNFQVNREEWQRGNALEDQTTKFRREDKNNLATRAQRMYELGGRPAAIDEAVSRSEGGSFSYGGFKPQPGTAQYQPVSVMNDETGQTDTFAFNRSTGGMARSGGANPPPVTSGVAQPTPLTDDAISSYRTQGAALPPPASPQAPAQALPQPEPLAPAQSRYQRRATQSAQYQPAIPAPMVNQRGRNKVQGAVIPPAPIPEAPAVARPSGRKRRREELDSRLY